MKKLGTSPKRVQQRATPIGKVFGHLKVVERKGTRTDGKPLWGCLCDCGKVTTVISYNVTSGRTTSCGCSNRNNLGKLRNYPPKTSPERLMWNKARARALNSARKRGVPVDSLFTITHQDIVIPPICPILGIPLFRGRGRHSANSPSIDQKVPGKGYTPDNIQVISHRANTLKSNATVQELEKVLAHLKML